MGKGLIGIGVDIIEIDRFAEIARVAPDGVASRLFTLSELEGGRANNPHYLASRFAAKEATMKALRCGMDRIPFRDIEVEADESGAPLVRLKGAAARIASESKVDTVMISISHSRTHAVAYAVAMGGDDDEACDQR